jgi:sigma-B regulation protein RsbU (phosphoserine phosphatase)
VIDRDNTTSAIGGESGYIIAMDTAPWPSDDFDPRRYPWYQGAKERGGLYWTDVYMDPRGRGPAVSCAMPFYDESGGGKVLKGVARSTALLADFSRIIASVQTGRAGYLFLLDQRGLRLFSSGGFDISAGADGRIVGENFLTGGSPRLRSLGLSMTMGASGMTELVMDGVSVYAAYAPVTTLGWSLGVAIPVPEISAPAWLIEERIHGLTGAALSGMDRYILVLAGIIALALLASLGTIALLSVRFTSGITGPILALNEGVREVSGGNLDREVSIKTGDELEELAMSFNAMRGRLRGHIAAIARASADKERIATELDIATRIQTSMLPNTFPPFQNRKNEFDLYATIQPAREVGGDFYDFFFIDDDHFALIIADVSGKGIPAALFMAITKTLIMNHLQSGEAPDLALENINVQLCGNNIADMFVTVWLGVLEISSGRLSYINAGHNPPLVQRGGRGFSFVRSSPDLVLAGMEDTVYRRRELLLAGGDTLFLYTDGITEAEDVNGVFYGGGRLLRFLDAHAELSLPELLSHLRAEIEEFCFGMEQSDDITMMALRIHRKERPLPAGPAMRVLVLDADTGKLPELIDCIGGELESAACPPKIRGQIELAAEEIFVNIAHYAYRGRAGTVTVSCGVERLPEGAALMTLSFVDRGEPFNPLEHTGPDITAPLEQRDIGGLGILIVKRATDTMRYDYADGENRLVITKSWSEPWRNTF